MSGELERLEELRLRIERVVHIYVGLESYRVPEDVDTLMRILVQAILVGSSLS